MSKTAVHYHPRAHQGENTGNHLATTHQQINVSRKTLTNSILLKVRNESDQLRIEPVDHFVKMRQYAIKSCKPYFHLALSGLNHALNSNELKISHLSKRKSSYRHTNRIAEQKTQLVCPSDPMPCTHDVSCLLASQIRLEYRSKSQMFCS